MNVTIIIFQIMRSSHSFARIYPNYSFFKYRHLFPSYGSSRVL